jgi:hypothetical protein
MFKTVKIASYEMGLYFSNGEFKGLLGRGRHWFFDSLLKTRVSIVSQRDPWLVHDKLDAIVKSGALKDRTVVIDLKDHQRALVWIDGRFSHVLPPGLYAYWTGFRDVTLDIVDARSVRFMHKDAHVITRSALADRVLEVLTVEQGHVGVLYVDGVYTETLSPGRHAFWKNVAKVTFVPVDLRETMYDVAGQEVMTADKAANSAGLRKDACSLAKRQTRTLWPGQWWRRGAEMLRADLKAARIPFKTEDVVSDFHSLRVTYITNLARGGVHPSIAQRLARHSVVTLTMGVYTRLSGAEIAEGLRGLPAPSALAEARTKCAPNK